MKKGESMTEEVKQGWKIEKELCQLSGHKAVNLVSWYGNKPTIDIRRWVEDAEGNVYACKGVTLTDGDAWKTAEAINAYLDGRG